MLETVSDDVNNCNITATSEGPKQRQGVLFAEDDEIIIEYSDANNNIESVESNNNDVDPPIRKQRVGSDGTEVGAIPVNEIAPDVNRRFYLGLTRPSVILRNRQERRRRREQRMQGDGGVNGEEEGAVSDEENLGLVQRISSVFIDQFTQNDTMVEATLVEENQEVYSAQQVGYCESRWKMFATIMAFMLVVFAVLLSVFIADDVEELLEIRTMEFPSLMPTAPSFNAGPTFDIVQERGYLICGLVNRTEDSFHVDLCRAISSVLLGGSDKIVKVPLTPANRFIQLQNRAVDVLVSGDTHTIEREVRERTTGVGFTFSSAYYYDGMSYFGNEKLVRCAEKNMRYKECASLVICVDKDLTSYDFVSSSFPSTFFLPTSSEDERIELMMNGTCNVIANDRSWLLAETISRSGLVGGDLIVGEKLMTKEPLAFVTRNDDREFSDIINWILHALFYGEEQGLSTTSSLCQNYTTPQMAITDLHFLNAVFCVGNYGDIVFDGERGNRGINQINSWTPMLYAIPFGDLEDVDESLDESGRLNDIRNDGLLKCGVNLPDYNFTGNLTNSDKLVGMKVDYCYTLASALFNGNWEAVQFVTFSENVDDSYAALDNGTIDVISGARIEKKYDFESTSLGGFQYSTPFYYGNETASDDVSFFSFATREGDATFSLFVNSVVLGTIFAFENNLNRKKSVEMPLIPIQDFSWALRDAILFSGSYNTIYEKNFGDALPQGRNALNNGGTPQILSFPGIAPISISICNSIPNKKACIKAGCNWDDFNTCSK